MPGIEPLVRFSTFLFLFSGFIFGQIHPVEKVDSLLRVGIENIILQDYPAAKRTFKVLNKEFQDLPLGEIYLAATEITQSVDYAEDLDLEKVDSLLATAMEKTEILLDEDDENLWNNYYEALIDGYMAYYHSITGNLISAFADGVLSLRAFQNCLELDKNFNEAFIALGTYNYWKSAQSESFLWLPFVDDKRQDGIDLLEKSIQNFSYNAHLAAYSLIWIYIDYGSSGKAVDLAEQMLNEYPGSRFFRWALARAYQDIDIEKAIEVFNEILISVETLQNSNEFNKIVLKHKMAMLYSEIDDYRNALSLCNEILDFNIKSDKIRKKLSNRIERTEDLKESILDKIK